MVSCPRAPSRAGYGSRGSGGARNVASNGASIPFVDPALQAPEAPVCWLIGAPILDGIADRPKDGTDARPLYRRRQFRPAHHYRAGRRRGCPSARLQQLLDAPVARLTRVLNAGNRYLLDRRDSAAAPSGSRFCYPVGPRASSRSQSSSLSRAPSAARRSGCARWTVCRRQLS